MTKNMKDGAISKLIVCFMISLSKNASEMQVRLRAGIEAETLMR
jgi:hypothetical protein